MYRESDLITSGSSMWYTGSSPDASCLGIMIATGATGSGSFVYGGAINLADLEAGRVYDFRLKYVEVTAGNVYILK